MASSLDYVEYLCEQFDQAGEITYKRMFGEYGLYFEGKYFAAICDDRLLVKITEPGKAFMPDCEQQLPYEGGSPMFFIDKVEDKAFLAELAEITCAALPVPKPRKKKSDKN